MTKFMAQPERQESRLFCLHVLGQWHASFSPTQKLWKDPNKKDREYPSIISLAVVCCLGNASEVAEVPALQTRPRWRWKRLSALTHAAPSEARTRSQFREKTLSVYL